MTDILLIGASALAREAMNIVRADTTQTVVGLIDDNESRWGTSVAGIPVLGGLEAVVEHPGTNLVICVSNGVARSRLVARLRALGVSDERFGRLVHPSVEIARNCRVGVGSILFAGVVMTADVTVGRHVVLMPNVTLSHGDRIESFATLGAGVSVGAGVKIGEEATLGMNSSVRERVRVGRRAVLGMGAVLLRDLPSRETWVGVPAANSQPALIGSLS